ncbi:MAG TPA: alpha/beta fold hydrolase [Candidatus Saccharimonadales bacterium]|nr:alpha/beta fold hydrolase [Candidatus Saccharimonadales bacterium]
MSVARAPMVARSSFTARGHRLAYTEFGEGKRWVLLMPGLLIPALMQERLAMALASGGAHVLALDPLGHGRSDRPDDMAEYSIESFAGDAIALLDHLDIDEAVIGGTSLGANVTLEVARKAPRRVRGIIIEMPVLENAMVASVIAFGPLLVALHFGGRLMRPVAAALRRIPRRLVPFWGNVALDVVRQDPVPSAALLKGLFFSHIAPHGAQRREMTMPALVIGHHIDPVHPFSDAGVLTGDLPNARLVEASNILELRLRPDRLTAEISAFVAECWSPRAVAKLRRQRRHTA